MWAGWGHASENPKLPELLQKNGIAFMGKATHFIDLFHLSFPSLKHFLHIVYLFPRSPKSSHVGFRRQDCFINCGSNGWHPNPALEWIRLGIILLQQKECYITHLQ